MFKHWECILPSFPPLFYSFFLSFGKHFIREIIFNKVKEILKEKKY